MTGPERFIGKYYVIVQPGETVMPGKLMKLINALIDDNKRLKGSLSEPGTGKKIKKLG
jgi:hypothetical protein